MVRRFGGWRRVARGVVDRIDRVKGSIFGVRRKNSPENFSGGGGGGRRRLGGGRPWLWWPDFMEGKSILSGYGCNGLVPCISINKERSSSLREYEMWEIRIKQYFQIQDYALWEVIEYGNSWVPIPITAPESGPSTALKMTVPSTTEEKICKKNDVKARTVWRKMLLQRKHKGIIEAAVENFNATSSESLTLSLTGISIAYGDTHEVVWMNKPDFETMGLDDLYNNFKIVEQKVKRTVAANNDDKNLAFLTTTSTSSTNSINTGNTGVSTGNSKVNTASAETSTASFSVPPAFCLFGPLNQMDLNLFMNDLEQIHDDELEEWI
ncbi:hypothetical protein Tco_0452771 [Tanacetum coccineum]